MIELNNIMQRQKTNIYLVVYDCWKRIKFTWYYETEFEKDKKKRALKYSNRYRLLEDSTDKYWDD